MKSKSLLILCAATLISFLPLSAAKYYLYNGTDPWGTRSDGTKVSVADETFHSTLNGYSVSDEIWIAQGTYTTTTSPAAIVPKAGMLIYGGFFGNEASISDRKLADETGGNGIAEPWEFKYPTIITGTGSAGSLASYVMFNSNTNYTLDGLTIQDHYVLARYGGAIFNSGTSATPTITKCIFRNINKSYDVPTGSTTGGGTVGYFSGNPTISSCLFENNILTVTSTGANSSYGGTIYVTKSATITGNVIRNNSVNGHATNTLAGGAIVLGGTVDTNTGLVANNLIYNNLSKNGAIYISNNLSAYNIVNNTIVNNYALVGSSSSVGGIANIPSNAKIYNNVVYNNAYSNTTSFKSFNSTVTVDLQNNAYNGTNTGSGGVFTGSNNNASLSAPNFVNPSTTIGYTASIPADVKAANFALQSTSSSLINQGGTFSITPSIPSTDILGNNRANGATANDIGAYEYYTPTVSLSTTSLTGFAYSGSGPSFEQSFTVSGTNLVSTITVTPSTNFEISTSSGSGFQSTAIKIVQTGIGNVATKTIYVRLKAGLTKGNFSNENVMVTASNTSALNVVCSASVTDKYYLYTGSDPWGTRTDGTKVSVVDGTLHTILNGYTASDEIWIAAGNYTTSTSPASIALKEGMKVYGGFYGNETLVSQRQLADETGGNGISEPWEFKYPTIITGTGAVGTEAAYVMFSSNTTYTLNGVTLENHTSLTQNGGAIYNNGASATPTISKCIFRNINMTYNVGTSTGGGIAIYALGAPVITSNLIENNVFRTDIGLNSGYGGMIYVGKSATITCNIIRNNTVLGGSVAIRHGGICIGNTADTNVGSIANNVIFNNTSSISVIYISGTANQYNIVNNTVVNNYANGLSSSAPIFNLQSNTKVYNNVVYNNDFFNGSSYKRSFNAAASATVDLQNNIYNGTTTVGTGGSFTSVNNNSALATPNFVNPATTIGYTVTMPADVKAANFALQATSTDLINKGGSFAGISPIIDILGSTRPTATNKLDVGAYEFSNQNISDYTDNSDIIVSSGGHLTIDGTKTVASITVAPGAKLTITSGNTLTATNGVNLQSDARGTATLVDNTTNAPQAVTGTVQQYLATNRNWYITPPIANVTVPSGQTYYSYDESGSNTNLIASATAYWVPEIQGTTLNPMKGYIVQPAASTTLNFTGTLVTGEKTLPLTRTTGKTKEGYNLVANPYPSYLDWAMVDTTAANIMTTVWYRTKTAGNAYTFDTYNGKLNVATSNGANLVSNLIPPMQAFWVRVKSGQSSGTLTFTNAMRKHVDNTTNKFKAPAVSETQIIRLRVSDGQYSDEALICFNPNAQNSFDSYDSQKMFENASSVMPEIYTQAGSEKLVINGLNAVSNETQIHVCFTAKQAGNFSISVPEMANFEAGTHIILKDKLLQNAETELSEGATYNFSSQITEPTTDRFCLLFRAPGGTTDVKSTVKLSAQVFVNTANQIIIESSENADVAIYNAMGQKQYENRLASTKTTIYNAFSAGVYFVELRLNGQCEIQKVIIR